MSRLRGKPKRVSIKALHASRSWMCPPLHDIAYRNSPQCREKDWSAFARICETRARSRHRRDWMNATHRKFVDGTPRSRWRSDNNFSQTIPGADRAPPLGVSSVEEATLRGASVPRPESGSVRLTGGFPPRLAPSEIVRVMERRGDLHPALSSEIVQAMEWRGDLHPLLSRWTASPPHSSRARVKLKERASFERCRSNKVFAKCKSPVPLKDTIDSAS